MLCRRNIYILAVVTYIVWRRNIYMLWPQDIYLTAPKIYILATLTYICYSDNIYILEHYRYIIDFQGVFFLKDNRQRTTDNNISLWVHTRRRDAPRHVATTRQISRGGFN